MVRSIDRSIDLTFGGAFLRKWTITQREISASRLEDMYNPFAPEPSETGSFYVSQSKDTVVIFLL